MSNLPIRLGVNIDHIATLRNARGGVHPSPVVGAQAAIAAGAHGITAHLREDRRHVRDDDIWAIRDQVDAPLNFEMAATEEMIKIASRVKPNACCLVPEKREEVTTEGGLDVVGNQTALTYQCLTIKGFDARVSLFIDPEPEALETSCAIGADIVELHTGELAHAFARQDIAAADQQMGRLIRAASMAKSMGLEVHAGHGLTYETAEMVAALPEMVELNIGHFLMGESILLGLPTAVEEMLAAMDRGVAARAETSAKG